MPNREPELTKETLDLLNLIKQGPMTKEMLKKETKQDYPGMSRRLSFLKSKGLIELKNTFWQACASNAK